MPFSTAAPRYPRRRYEPVRPFLLESLKSLKGGRNIYLAGEPILRSTPGGTGRALRERKRVRDCWSEE